jgi:hypothetical protein
VRYCRRRHRQPGQTAQGRNVRARRARLMDSAVIHPRQPRGRSHPLGITQSGPEPLVGGIGQISLRGVGSSTEWKPRRVAQPHAGHVTVTPASAISKRRSRLSRCALRLPSLASPTVQNGRRGHDGDRRSRAVQGRNSRAVRQVTAKLGLTHAWCCSVRSAFPLRASPMAERGSSTSGTLVRPSTGPPKKDGWPVSGRRRRRACRRLGVSAPWAVRPVHEHLVPTRSTTHAEFDEQDRNDSEEGSWPGYPR